MSRGLSYEKAFQSASLSEAWSCVTSLRLLRMSRADDKAEKMRPSHRLSCHPNVRSFQRVGMNRSGKRNLFIARSGCALESSGRMSE